MRISDWSSDVCSSDLRRNERFSDERVAIGIPAAQATMNARTKQAATGRSAGARARITHPDRIVFEGAGYTKVDVADYYRSVAQWLLPDLDGRPLSLLRCPDGRQAECLFPKPHAASPGHHLHSPPPPPNPRPAPH